MSDTIKTNKNVEMTNVIELKRALGVQNPAEAQVQADKEAKEAEAEENPGQLNEMASDAFSDAINVMAEKLGVHRLVVEANFRTKIQECTIAALVDLLIDNQIINRGQLTRYLKPLLDEAFPRTKGDSDK